MAERLVSGRTAVSRARRSPGRDARSCLRSPAAECSGTVARCRGPRGLDDRRGDLADRLGAEACGTEELLGALLGARDDRSRLRAGPVQGLGDVGAGRVRELGRLMPRLLEQPGAASFGVPGERIRLAFGAEPELARLEARGVDHLEALPLGVEALHIELRLVLTELAMLPAHLTLDAAVLLRRRSLGVPLQYVCELGSRPDQPERVHADRVADRLGLAGATGSLKHAKLGVQLQHRPAEDIEGSADRVLVEPAPGHARKILEYEGPGRARGELTVRGLEPWGKPPVSRQFDV